MWFVCYKPTATCKSTSEKNVRELTVFPDRDQYYYGSVRWRKAVINQCSDFATTHRCPGSIKKKLNVNPFTAMLAAPSLGKRSNKSVKFETIKAFHPFTWARERIFIKMVSIENRFVIGPSHILFWGVHACTFQPGNFTGCGSEGVNKKIKKIKNAHTHKKTI